MKAFNKSNFHYYYNNGFFWFRLFGYEIKAKDTTKYDLLFSERQGITKELQIAKYRLNLLKPNGI